MTVIDKMGRFLIAFLTLPLSSPFTPHFSVRPLTRISKFAALIKKFFPQPPVAAYSLTRLILRRFELASHKGRGNCFVAIYSTVQLFNHSPVLLPSLFTLHPSLFTLIRTYPPYRPIVLSPLFRNLLVP